MRHFTINDYQNIYAKLGNFLPYYLAVFVLLELCYLIYIGQKLLIREARTNIVSGLIAIATQAILKNYLLIGGYYFLYNHRIINTANTFIVFIYAFFLFSFLHYVVHYLNHKVRLFWCLHVVHHSATEMNSTTGIRTSIFDIIGADVLYFAIPFLGVPPLVFFIVYAVAKIWGNFIHVNENIVSKIPFLNKILVDPAMHHVHHASNIIYLDKNYGETIVLYDKLFGTFQQLSEPPVYGILSNEKPHGFWNIQLHEFRHLAKDIKQASSLKHKLQYLFMPPGWAADGQAKTTKQIQSTWIQAEDRIQNIHYQ
jgi:sterol desaturase/sphingolipid hydroxylase (fatty acid hydroxylase superfamily)